MNEDKTSRGGLHPMLFALPPERAKKGKIVSAEEAVQVISDGDTVPIRPSPSMWPSSGGPPQIRAATSPWKRKPWPEMSFSSTGDCGWDPKDSFACLSRTGRKKDNNETNIIDS